jgi:hypothetical protein
VIALSQLNSHRRGGGRFVVAVVAALAAAPAAFAADVLAPAPVYTKAPEAAATGWYTFIDGIYDRVHLPTYALGLHNGGAAATNFADIGPVSSFDPKLDGGGLRGGVGYHLPGTSWRLELGGSYIEANGSQRQSATTTADSAGFVFLNGTAPLASKFCTTGLACTTDGQLTSAYKSWQINGKAAYDATWGGATISPFVALFGGSSRNDQTLNQSLVRTSLGVVTDNLTYDAGTSLRWNDFGARFGLDTTAPLTSWLAWNFSGSIGLAGRSVSLSGADSVLGSGKTSGVSDSTRTTALVANLESGFTVKPTPWLTLRAFGGISFDDRVPGISAPTAINFILLPGGLVPGTPAGINFSHETSYYAGGGASWKF